MDYNKQKKEREGPKPFLELEEDTHVGREEMFMGSSHIQRTAQLAILYAKQLKSMYT